jgi:DNA topoisomerase-1
MSALSAVGLRYVTDSQPGIRRRRSGRGFTYLDVDGKRVKDPAALARIRSIVIPPAWTDVWICPSAAGHIQATGRDARGRKQYRYHPDWHAVQGATKFDRLLVFGRSLPRLRRCVRRDLRQPGLPRDRVLALLVRLLDVTGLRVGNTEYARSNGSFGLTTLRNRHARVRGSRLQLTFRGKSGVVQRVEMDDRRLARLVKRCQELPGQELFCYVDDDGSVQSVESADVNENLRSATGEDFTAKDFRTWAGTLLAWQFLAREANGESSSRQRQRMIRQAVKHVAAALGNTSAVCRKFYIHPAVLDSFVGGEVGFEAVPASRGELKSAERSLLRFLKQVGRRARRRTGVRAPGLKRGDSVLPRTSSV